MEIAARFELKYILSHAERDALLSSFGRHLVADAHGDVAQVVLAHQAPLVLNEASAAWILTSTALVLLMTLPGLALFYGGMVRRKNVIATVTQSLGVAAVVTLAWFIAGYGLSFGVGQPIGGYSGEEVQSYIGSFQALFLNGVTPATALNTRCT